MVFTLVCTFSVNTRSLSLFALIVFLPQCVMGLSLVCVMAFPGHLYLHFVSFSLFTLVVFLFILVIFQCVPLSVLVQYFWSLSVPVASKLYVLTQLTQINLISMRHPFLSS